MHNQMQISVTSRRVFDMLILDITLGARSSIALTVPEAIDLIRKIESRL